MERLVSLRGQGSRTLFVIALACVLGVISAAPALGAPGQLDATFGGDGRVVTNLTDGFDSAKGVAIQPDGKIVAVGLAGEFGRFGLARYKPNGRLDAGFGDGGTVMTNFTGRVDMARAVAIQPDGKIVVAGFAGDQAKFALARYNSDGTLDPTFGGDGKVITNITLGVDIAYGVTIQSDGKIVAAGSAHEGSGDGRFALARYNDDGTLDSTFGGDGTVITDFTPQIDLALALAIQANGKIVAAGEAGKGVSGSFALARYLPHGRLDSAFGGDGRVTTNLTGGDDFANAVAIQANGKIVAAGTGGYTKFALVRYELHGSLDPTFAGNGVAMTDFTGRDDIAHGVAIQANGKIVAAGSAREGYGDSKFALARYRTSGRLDGTFGGDGRVMTDFTGSGDYAHAVAIQPDGKIVAAGEAAVRGGTFALVRYLDA